MAKQKQTSNITIIEEYDSWTLRVQDKEFSQAHKHKYTEDNTVYLHKFKSLETILRYVLTFPYLAKISKKHPITFKLKGLTNE
ncbi:MAG: hypothetical protein Q8P20_01065 [bacterium]|nr:hypothetical protein [bacterium]